VWRLLLRLDRSPQRPARRAIERDEAEIARWRAEEWLRIKRGAGAWRVELANLCRDTITEVLQAAWQGSAGSAKSAGCCFRFCGTADSSCKK
jgi:hypothetical protein